MESFYRLREYEIDVLGRQLRRDGELLGLVGKPFDVLLALAARAGRVVSKDELMEAVWHGAVVEESNLTQCVFILRKAFGERSSNAHYFITVPGIGYQLGVIPELMREASSLPNAHAVEHEAAAVPVTAGPVQTGVAARSTAHWLLWSLLVAAALLLAGFSFHALHTEPPTFLHSTVRQLTNSGNVLQAAISLSGRYVAYTSRSGQGDVDLTVLDLKSKGSQTIYKAVSATVRDPRFAPDEAFVYFRRLSHAQHPEIWTEMRIPLPGGEPAFVVRDVDGSVSFLDEGKRICFGREDGKGNLSIVSTSAQDGGAERILARTGWPSAMEAVCSPDGKFAVLATESNGLNMLDLRSGARTSLQRASDSHEIVIEAIWSADSTSLVTSSVLPFNMSPHLSRITYPAEKRSSITAGLDSLGSPGLSSDGHSLVARRGDLNQEVHSFLSAFGACDRGFVPPLVFLYRLER